jgi:hypothetical protein
VPKIHHAKEVVIEFEASVFAKFVYIDHFEYRNKESKNKNTRR